MQAFLVPKNLAVVLQYQIETFIRPFFLSVDTLIPSLQLWIEEYAVGELYWLELAWYL